MRRVVRRLGVAFLVLAGLGVAGYVYLRYRNPPPELAEPKWYT